jgi:hypothetical protein
LLDRRRAAVLGFANMARRYSVLPVSIFIDGHCPAGSPFA